jgi:hypothetical protein
MASKNREALQNALWPAFLAAAVFGFYLAPMMNSPNRAVRILLGFVYPSVLHIISICSIVIGSSEVYSLWGHADDEEGDNIKAMRLVVFMVWVAGCEALSWASTYELARDVPLRSPFASSDARLSPLILAGVLSAQLLLPRAPPPPPPPPPVLLSPPFFINRYVPFLSLSLYPLSPFLHFSLSLSDTHTHFFCKVTDTNLMRMLMLTVRPDTGDVEYVRHVVTTLCFRGPSFPCFFHSPPSFLPSRLSFFQSLPSFPSFNFLLFLSSFFPSFLLSFLPSFFPSFLPSFLPSFTCLFSFTSLH